jgi:ABC-type sugar transport system ATPase subunit
MFSPARGPSGTKDRVEERTVSVSESDGRLLQVRGLVKDYPGVRALGGVDLAVDSGQVHCLIGQNGAGKSTLIKCVSGLVEPTAGEVRFQGEPLPVGDPNASIARGIATIYQELDLVPHLSVALNVFLGHEHKRGPILNRAAMHRETEPLLAVSVTRASLQRRRSRPCGRRSNSWSQWPEPSRTRSSC